MAASEFSVIAPLKEAGLSKADVRELSRKLGLPTADAPAQPCLSSRIPHGTPVTREVLDQVEQGEAVVRSFGFKVFRVRYLPPADGQGLTTTRPGAKIQIAPGEMGALEAIKEKMILKLTGIGFETIEIDPEGYRGQQ